MRIPPFPVLLTLAAAGLSAQEPPIGELLEALARTSATFAVSVPNLTARESLLQKGRHGLMEITKQGRHHEIKDVAFTIPPDFQHHEVVSDYSFGVTPTAPSFHEVRRVLTVDGAPAKGNEEIRHTMTIGLENDDDDALKRNLENLEQASLEGAATDFGPLLLLFTREHIRDYRFTVAGHRTLSVGNADEPAIVLHYRQLAGPESFTEFRDRSEIRHRAEGQIWFRERDLLPLRMTIATEEAITPRNILRNEADVIYCPTPFGLAPSTVLHRQYLNEDLLVENSFRYSAYNGKAWLP